MTAIVPCEHGRAPGICVTCLQRQLQQARLEADSWEQGCGALRAQLQQAIKRAEAAEEALAMELGNWRPEALAEVRR